MIRLFRPLTAPLYLLVAILIGGSAQAVWGNLILQLTGLGLIGWALIGGHLRDTSVGFGLLLAGAVLLLAVQLVPLPPALWASLPGRAAVWWGFSLLDQPAPWLPISLAPHATIAAALALVPPIAIFAAMQRLGAFRSDWLAFALAAAAMMSLLLGVVQVSAGEQWYMFDLTNRGAATGFFANANHLATLLVGSLPFVSATVVTLSVIMPARTREIRIIGSIAALLLLGGVVLTGSLAGILLFAVAAAASLLLFPRSRLARSWVLGAAAAIVIGGAAAASSMVVGHQVSVSSRQQIWLRTAALTAEYLPAGSGIGTFPQVYQAHEDPGSVDRVFVNHAHNDYIEVLLEGGLPALALVIAFLWWWVRAAIQAWRSDTGDAVLRAATIASGIILAHSFVDYPLRTAAVSVMFAACVALMARARPSSSAHGISGRAARHLVAR